LIQIFSYKLGDISCYMHRLYEKPGGNQSAQCDKHVELCFFRSFRVSAEITRLISRKTEHIPFKWANSYLVLVSRTKSHA